MRKTLCLLLALATPAAGFAADAVDERLGAYSGAGAGPFSAEAGAKAWTTEHAVAGERRSCASCHGSNLTQAGRHARTGRPIEAMAPSVNPKRLSDGAKIEKWFLRNCKWTLGRECTPQEKGDFLTYLRGQ